LGGYAAPAAQTYTGTILVAVNPYKPIPELYSQDALKRYERAPLGSQPPHVFALVENAYRHTDFGRLHKSLLISGESGAGKTETTKLILNFLTHLSGAHSSVEQLILESSPILEAFGNATTTANDNSSRFVSICFHTPRARGAMCGANHSAHARCRGLGVGAAGQVRRGVSHDVRQDHRRPHHRMYVAATGPGGAGHRTVASLVGGGAMEGQEGRTAANRRCLADAAVLDQQSAAMPAGPAPVAAARFHAKFLRAAWRRTAALAVLPMDTCISERGRAGNTNGRGGCDAWG